MLHALKCGCRRSVSLLEILGGPQRPVVSMTNHVQPSMGQPCTKQSLWHPILLGYAYWCFQVAKWCCTLPNSSHHMSALPRPEFAAKGCPKCKKKISRREARTLNLEIILHTSISRVFIKVSRASQLCQPGFRNGWRFRGQISLQIIYG